MYIPLFSDELNNHNLHGLPWRLGGEATLININRRHAAMQVNLYLASELLTPLVTHGSLVTRHHARHRSSMQPGNQASLQKIVTVCTTQLKVSLTLGKFNHDIEAKHSHVPVLR